jgi:calcium/calmodulin-dependent protein kinase I
MRSPSNEPSIDVSVELLSPLQRRSIFQVYTLGEEIGRGAFSIVKKGRNMITEQEVAIKVLKRKFLLNSNSITREIEIMKRLNHPNILRLLDVYENEEYVFIVLPLIEGGSLFEKIVEYGCFYEDDAQYIIRQILQAVGYLHQCGIVHRDLKAENVLCDKDFDESYAVYISDFGLSRKFSDEEEMTTFCGSPEYCAPEILDCAPYEKAVDLWAVGIITFFLLTGAYPFDGPTPAIIFEKITDVEYKWDDSLEVSDLAKNFVQSLLVKNPKKRMTAEQALKHPWLQPR